MRERKVGNKAILYYLVAFYIGYQGYLILKNRFTGDATMSFPLAVTVASVLILGAAGIIGYTLIHTRNKTGEEEKEQSTTEIE